MGGTTQAAGTVGWLDLTVRDAESVRDFYRDVVGWTFEAQPMGDYEDFVMTHPDTGEPVAGVCHARGVNEDLPAQWIPYVIVESLERSLVRCTALGGRVIRGPRGSASAPFAVVADPAGAVMALCQREG